MKFWHYTTYPSFLNILEERKIRTSFAAAALGILEGPEVVWLSTNPVWEESVQKAIKSDDFGESTKLLSKDELFRKGHYPVRLQTNERLSNLVSWGQAKKMIGLNRDHIREIEKIPKMRGGSITEWWVSSEPITLSCILLPIEIWNGRQWENIEQFEFR